MNKIVDKLGLRELQVLQLIAQGQTDKEMGATLFLSENTIGTYVLRLMTALDAKTRSHAVAIGYQRGLLVLPEAA